MADKEIFVSCVGADTVPLDELKVIQGTLKVLSTTDAERLRGSILKHGFMAPIFIWEKKLKSGSVYSVLDGTQRITVLSAMAEEGFEIPALPVVYIQAKSLKDAKEKLLYISSQYGQMTLESVIEFAEDMEIDWGELRLSAGELEIRDIEFEDYADFEESEKKLDGMEDVEIKIIVPAKFKDEVVTYLSNGNKPSAPGMGKGVLALCGLL